MSAFGIFQVRIFPHLDWIRRFTAIIHDDINYSHSHFEEKVFQAIDHLKEASYKWLDIDSIFDFISKSAASKNH